MLSPVYKCCDLSGTRRRRRRQWFRENTQKVVQVYKSEKEKGIICLLLLFCGGEKMEIIRNQ